MLKYYFFQDVSFIWLFVQKNRKVLKKNFMIIIFSSRTSTEFCFLGEDWVSFHSFQVSKNRNFTTKIFSDTESKNALKRLRPEWHKIFVNPKTFFSKMSQDPEFWSELAEIRL